MERMKEGMSKRWIKKEIIRITFFLNTQFLFFSMKGTVRASLLLLGVELISGPEK